MRTSIVPLLILLCISTIARVEADPSAQSPAPTTSPAACSIPTSITPDKAFAHSIDDPRTLAFISYVERLPTYQRSSIQRSVPLSTTARAELDREMADPCTASEVAYRTTRLLYVMAKRWDSNDALDFEPAVRLAIAALFLGDRLSSQTRESALANFVTSEERLDALRGEPQTRPEAADSATPGCPHDIDPLVTHPEVPDYPARASQLRVSATVLVYVALESHGYVRSATLYKNTINSGASDEDIVSAAIISAGSSDYSPRLKACLPVSGSYLFRTEFNSH